MNINFSWAHKKLFIYLMKPKNTNYVCISE